MSEQSANAQRLYGRYARFYERRTRGFSELFLSREVDLFLSNLPGKRILDLGSGPGRDSFLFKQRGYEPLCLDISEGMLEICRQKGLNAVRMSFEDLSFDPECFDGVWSYTSLTTVPKKTAENVIRNVHSILKEKGIFFLGIIEGDFEGWKPPDAKYELPRFQSKYRKEEIERICSQFDQIYFSRITREQTGRNDYMNFILRKR